MIADWIRLDAQRSSIRCSLSHSRLDHMRYLVCVICLCFFVVRSFHFYLFQKVSVFISKVLFSLCDFVPCDFDFVPFSTSKYLSCMVYLNKIPTNRNQHAFEGSWQKSCNELKTARSKRRRLIFLQTFWRKIEKYLVLYAFCAHESFVLDARRDASACGCIKW